MKRLKNTLLTLGVVTLVGAPLALVFSSSATAAEPDECCCVVENNALVCTFTGQTLAECCCK